MVRGACAILKGNPIERKRKRCVAVCVRESPLRLLPSARIVCVCGACAAVIERVACVIRT
eukprot:m.448320 g.448320  ORF g.448320 m.448320 type:complete len:60 (-) comp159498_c0_seq1:322-501(-)